jgi:hypothetical protein
MLMGVASLLIMTVLLLGVVYGVYKWQRIVRARRRLHGRLAVLALRAVRPVKPLSRQIMVKMRQEMANQDQSETTNRGNDQAGSGPAAPERARLAGKSGMANQTDLNRDWHSIDLPDRMMNRKTVEARTNRRLEAEEVQNTLTRFTQRRQVMQQRATWMRVTRERQAQKVVVQIKQS